MRCVGCDIMRRALYSLRCRFKHVLQVYRSVRGPIVLPNYRFVSSDHEASCVLYPYFRTFPWSVPSSVVIHVIHIG